MDCAIKYVNAINSDILKCLIIDVIGCGLLNFRKIEYKLMLIDYNLGKILKWLSIYSILPIIMASKTCDHQLF